jgi:agmatine/peptidylarginine deiminase
MKKQTRHLHSDESRRLVLELIAGLNPDKPWTVTVERYVKKRSINQNSLYWKWNGILADDTGNDVDAIHEFVKQKFLVPKLTEIDGETIETRSTKNLTTAEMKDLMDAYYAWAATDLGIRLPVPEELRMRAA